jgi:hypothetical protein
MTGGANDITLTANDGEACLRKPFALGDLVAALKTVEGIVNGKDAEPPFPPGFEVLRHPLDQHMPENPEMTAANLKLPSPGPAIRHRARLNGSRQTFA